jgi:hypothetical protein
MIRRVQALLVCILSTATAVDAQVFRFEQKSVCDLLKAPRRFSGSLVSIRAELIAVREWLLVDDTDQECGRLAAAHPADPEVSPKPGFTLIRDRSLEEFERALPVLNPSPSGTRGRIIATFEGRFDWTPRGSGHSRLRKTRLVLHRVSDVTVIPAP